MPTVAEVIKRLNWAKGQHIAVAIWCEEDVIERAKEKGVIMGHKPAAEIMDALDHDHDCELGITWDSLDYYIDEFRRKHPHYHRCSEEEEEE